MPPFNPAQPAARREYYGVRPKKKKRPRPVRKPPGMSIEEWARQQVEEIFGAQRESILAQKQAYLDELKRQSDLELQRGQQIAEQLRGMNFPGTIQGIYGDAAGGLQALGQGFSQETQQIANQQAAEQSNMLAGTGQEGAVRNAGGAMGDVVYGLGGYMPARTMGETGAAFASDAALQPGFALQDAGRRASEIYSEGLGGLQDFAAMMAELEGQKPLMQREMIAERRSLVDEQRDYRDQKAQDEREWFLKMAAYYNAIGDDKRADHYLRLAQQREQRQVNSGMGLDAAGNPKPGYRINPKTNTVEKVPTKKSSKANTVDWGDLQLDMVSDLEDFVEEVPNPDPYVGGNIKKKISRADAYMRLFNKYSGLVKNKGRLKRLINKILDRGGFPKPKPSSSDDGYYPGRH